MTAGGRLFAQDEGEMKPLFVAALRSYEELIGDLDAIGKASDNPDLAQGIEGLIQLVTQGQGLVGLDKTKPWGLAVSSDGIQFQIVGFLPVNDLEKFMSALGGVAGEPQKTDDGVWKVELQGQSLSFKQGGQWTFVSLGAEFLGDLPEDPSKLLDGLHEQYDGAVRIYIQNIPEIFRQLAIEQLKIGLEQGLGGEGMQIPGLDNLPGGGQLPGMDSLPKLSEEQQKLAAAIARGQLDAMSAMMNEVDQITFGLTIDSQSKKLSGDVVMTAVAGSKTAEELAKMSDGKSKFAGFKKCEPAALTANVSLNLTESDIRQAKETIGAIQEDLNQRIADFGLGDDHIKELLKEFVDKLMSIGRETFDSGRVDVGAALVGEGPFTLLAGGYIKDDEAATKLFDELVETVESEAGFYGIEKNVVEHKGVQFSRVLLPIPPGEEGDAIANLFGSDVELVIGIGKQSAYIGLGRDCVEGLKKAIDASEQAADQKVAPLEVVAKLSPLSKLAAESQDADPNAALVAGALEDGKDQLTITLSPCENGTKVHFEGEEGLLKVLGTMMTQLGAAIPQLQ
jgi:hypothetical protein